jgi:hypothetical protein
MDFEVAGIPDRFVFRKRAVELPGYFRPTKEWDLLLVRDKTLIAAVEAKSQVGPSFGNNFNNRTEANVDTIHGAVREDRELYSVRPARKRLGA